MLMALVAAANAEELVVTVLASLDSDRIAASGMKTERKTDMPDFTITYLHGPEAGDVIGIYDGGYPSAFSKHGKRLGEVKDTIAGQPVVWTCWSQDVEGKTRYGAEALLPSRRTVITVGGTKDESLEQFHVFIYRSDLKTLAMARKLAASIFRKGMNP